MVFPLLLFALEEVAVASIIDSTSKIIQAAGDVTVTDQSIGDLLPGEFAIWWYSTGSVSGPAIITADNELDARAAWLESSPSLQIAKIVGTAKSTPAADPIVGDRPQSNVFTNNVSTGTNNQIQSSSSLKIAVIVGLIIGTFIALK